MDIHSDSCRCVVSWTSKWTVPTVTSLNSILILTPTLTLTLITSVRYYTIDTESDMPTRSHPSPVPALLQIQAIHQESQATVFLVEVQHLPSFASPLFKTIQDLCRFIFSSHHHIIAWGDVTDELRPFLQFNLFDISQLGPTTNLQSVFTKHWNEQHPHQPHCSAQLNYQRRPPLIISSVSLQQTTSTTTTLPTTSTTITALASALPMSVHTSRNMPYGPYRKPFN